MSITYPRINRREGGTFFRAEARREADGVVEEALRRERATQPQAEKMASLPARDFRIGSNQNGQINFGIILFLLFLAVVIAYFFFGQTIQSLSFSLILLAPFIFIIAFLDSDLALVILIFSMLLSPEFSLGGVRGREVVLRMDDIFLLIIFVGWLTKTAINKELGLLRTTPINQPMIVYTFICLIATLFGFLRNTVRLKEGIFYFLKYIEYFLLYFMVVNSLKDMRQVKRFVYSMLFVVLVTAVYAWSLHFSGAARVTAPFEGKEGEPNTLGGYLLFMMMCVAGLLLNLSSLKSKFFLSFILMIVFPAFLFTLSRGSWLGFIPAYLTLMFLSRKGKEMLFVVSVLFVVLFSTIFPGFVYERIKYTFTTQTERTVFGRHLTLDESVAARIDIWKQGFKYFNNSPLIGYGVGSVGPAFDNQYVRVLLEAGIIGFLVFNWMLLSIFRNSLRVLYQAENDNFAHGLTAGFIAGFVGLLMHAFGAATFILIRIMEPFWFLTAIIMTLSELHPAYSPDVSPGAGGEQKLI